MDNPSGNCIVGPIHFLLYEPLFFANCDLIGCKSNHLKIMNLIQICQCKYPNSTDWFIAKVYNKPFDGTDSWVDD